MKFSRDQNTYVIKELTQADCDAVASWFDSAHIHKWFDFGMGRQKLDTVSLRMMSSSPDHFVRIIVDDQNRRHAVCGLQQVRNPFRVAQFWGIRQMVRPPAPVRHVEAVRVMFRQAFQMFELSSVQAWAVDGNVKSIRLLEQLGFKQCGRLRRCHLINGTFLDRIMYDLLPEEFGLEQDMEDFKGNVNHECITDEEKNHG
jgi:RimJ/RimL family protein N-acetyltransferase